MRLEHLFDVPGVPGVFDDEVWRFTGHPSSATAMSVRGVNWRTVPTDLRTSMKELVIIAALPAMHGAAVPTLMAMEPRDLATIVRWLSTLPIDLAWLRHRAGSIEVIGESAVHAWKSSSGFNIDHRRVRALKAFYEYGLGFTPGVARLREEPWPGISAYLVAGGKPKKKGHANATPPLHFDDLGPLLIACMTVLHNGPTFLDAVAAGRRTVLKLNTLDGGGAHFPLGRTQVCAGRDAKSLLAAVSMFTVPAFTGMRSEEVEAIPRYDNLETIRARGVERSLIKSFMTKGQPEPVSDVWLVPPIAVDAITTMQDLLDRLNIPPDTPFDLTGLPPLFDRRALAKYVKSAVKTTMRFDRVVDEVMSLTRRLHECGIGPPPRNRVNNRELRRTFARIVASRPGGTHAAMQQFKWQESRTARGYFEVDPDALSVSQRELYQEIAGIERELLLDTAVHEFVVWRAALERDRTPPVPAGPGGEALQRAFRALYDDLSASGTVVEDERRLRNLLAPRIEHFYTTEFGFCNFDESMALCEGRGAPNPEMCRPNECLCSSTTSTGLAAQRVKHDRLVRLTKDGRLPSLARERVRAEATVMEKDLGSLLMGTQ